MSHAPSTVPTTMPLDLPTSSPSTLLSSSLGPGIKHWLPHRFRVTVHQKSHRRVMRQAIEYASRFLSVKSYAILLNRAEVVYRFRHRFLVTAPQRSSCLVTRLAVRRACREFRLFLRFTIANRKKTKRTVVSVFLHINCHHASAPLLNNLPCSGKILKNSCYASRSCPCRIIRPGGATCRGRRLLKEEACHRLDALLNVIRHYTSVRDYDDDFRVDAIFLQM
jgi:hypothetical protein